MVDLGECCDGALAAAAAGALLDGNRRRDAEDRIDVGARGRLHELPCVGVQGLEVAPLALVEEDVEGERRLARARDPGDHREAVARDLDVDVLQVVLARVVDDDRRCGRAAWPPHRRARLRRRAAAATGRGGRRAPARRRRSAWPVKERGSARTCAGVPAHTIFAAALPALRPQVDDPVGGADDVEVVLDHQQRVPGGQELAEGTQQLCHVLEVQPRGRLVEQEQLAAVRGAGEHRGGLRQVAGELQALRLAAGERRHRLAELHVLKADVRKRRQRVRRPRAHRRRTRAPRVTVRSEHLGDVQAAPVRALAADLQHLIAVAAAVAVRAAQVHVREELHLHVLEAVAAAGRAAAVAGVEAEGAGGVLALLGGGLGGEQRADRIEGADVACRVGARGAPDRVLIDHDHVVDELSAGKACELARCLGGLAAVLQQRRVQHVLHERRLARAGYAGDAHQALERDAHVDVLQVVLAGALAARASGSSAPRPRRPPRAARTRAQRSRVAGATRLAPLRYWPVSEAAWARISAGVPKKTISPPRSPAPGPRSRMRSASSMICGSCSTTTQGVAGIAQALHDPDDALHVARVQADRGLIEHEQRVDERGAERGREIDALHLPARERARLAVEGEVAQAHVARGSGSARGSPPAAGRWPHPAAAAA